MFALHCDRKKNVNEYVDAGIELSSIPASTSASVLVYIDFRSQLMQCKRYIVNQPLHDCTQMLQDCSQTLQR